MAPDSVIQTCKIDPSSTVSDPSGTVIKYYEEDVRRPGTPAGLDLGVAEPASTGNHGNEEYSVSSEYSATGGDEEDAKDLIDRDTDRARKGGVPRRQQKQDTFAGLGSTRPSRTIVINRRISYKEPSLITKVRKGHRFFSRTEEANESAIKREEDLK